MTLTATALAVALVSFGCSATDATGRPGGTAGDALGVAANGGTGAPIAGDGAAGYGGVSGNPAAGGGGQDPDGIGGTGGGTTGGRATTGSTPMPCDVVTILKTNCQSCHGATPLAGVPMALVSWEDTQKPSVSNPSMSVHDMMKLRIHSATTVMPPPPSTPLSVDALATLDAWLNSGAIAGNDPSCKPASYYGGEMPPDVENCYEVHAHANSVSGDTAPLMVQGENYSTFYFDAPWPDGAQGVYFETLPGDHPEVIHHWLIYAEENSDTPDGTVNYPAFGTHPSAPTLVAGWAPGANNNDLPSNVGMQLSGANRKMSMEIHFYGQQPAAVPVTAGVKICTVEKHLRPNTATVSWLGTELGIGIAPMAQDSVATGICTPQNQTEDIHVIRSWPHMHLMGRAMESTLVHKDGTREQISPDGGWPFNFNSEVSWKTEYVVHPGDTIETKCHYTNTSNNFIAVGFENRYEMCFNFTLAYPAKALVNKIGTSSSLTNSATACEF